MSNTYYASSTEQLVYQHPDNPNFRFYFKVRSTNLENELRKNYQDGEIYENVVSKLAFLPSNLLANVGLVMENLFSEEADLEILSSTASAWISTLEGYENDDLDDLGSVFTIDVMYYKDNNEYQFSMGDKDFPIFTYTSQSTMEFLVGIELLKMNGVSKKNKSQSLSTSTVEEKSNLKQEKKDTSQYGSETISFTDSKGNLHEPIVIKSPYYSKHMEDFAGQRVAYQGFKIELDKKSAGGKTGSPTYYFYAYFNRQEKEWGKSAICTMKKDYVDSNKEKIPTSLLNVMMGLEMGEPKTYKEDYLVVWCADNRTKKAENPKLSFLDDFSVNPIGIVKGKSEENIVPPTPEGFGDTQSAPKKVSSAMFGGKSKARA